MSEWSRLLLQEKPGACCSGKSIEVSNWPIVLGYSRHKQSVIRELAPLRADEHGENKMSVVDTCTLTTTLEQPTLVDTAAGSSIFCYWTSHDLVVLVEMPLVLLLLVLLLFLRLLLSSSSLRKCGLTAVCLLPLIFDYLVHCYRAPCDLISQSLMTNFHEYNSWYTD